MQLTCFIYATDFCSFEEASWISAENAAIPNTMSVMSVYCGGSGWFLRFQEMDSTAHGVRNMRSRASS